MLKKCKRFLATHPRIRVLVFICLAIIIFIAVLNIMTRKPANADKPHVGSSAINPSETRFNHSRNVGIKKYNALITQKNTQDRNAAQQSGRSYFRGSFDGGKDVPNTPEQAQQPQKPQKTQANTEVPEDHHPLAKPIEIAGATTPSRKYALAQEQNQQPYQGQVTTQEPADSEQVSQLSQEMNSSLQSLSKSWDIPKMAQSASPSSTATAGTMGTMGPGGTMPSGLGATPTLIKAGDIMFAVLDTALNSDQANTPVMAKIVSGQYRNATLLGKFTREGDKLVIQFTRMSTQSQASSITISAYAIDATTAQNALASSVNHHYVVRYGSLFAAAFLQGYGDAYSSAQNPCGNNGVCILGNFKPDPATTKSAISQGIGTVGEKLSDVVAQNFDMPPTVKLKQGSGMGILFMSDVKAGATS